MNIQLINKLKECGLQFEISEKEQSNTPQILQGETIVVSGVFEKINRNDLKKLIEDYGGKVSSSISKKTSYIVAGENMGPSKKTKAENLGVPILSEEEFLGKIMC